MKKIIATDQAPAAIGPYSQAVEVNNMLFASGQIPVNPATGEFASDEIVGQTVQVFKNIDLPNSWVRVPVPAPP